MRHTGRRRSGDAYHRRNREEHLKRHEEDEVMRPNISSLWAVQRQASSSVAYGKPQNVF